MPRKVAILHHNQGFAGELGVALADAFRNAGCKVDLVAPDDPWAHHYDLVVGYGPHNIRYSMLPVINNLNQEGHRPYFFLWCTESMPLDWKHSLLILRVLIGLHGHLRYATFLEVSLRGARLWILNRFLPKSFRLAVMGEVFAFRSRGFLDGFAVTAQHNAKFCESLGLKPLVIPIGYHPKVHGQDLNLDRNVDVAFLGRIHENTTRRSIILQQIKAKLNDLGIRLTEAHEYCDGYKRTIFLNRAKITINILQNVHAFTGLRLILCAANKTLIVSEYMRDYGPFIPGTHIVVTSVDNIADTVAYYLKHRGQRKVIVEAAHKLVVEDMTMTQTVNRIIAATQA